MKTVTLKRVSLHIAFWLAYLTEDVTLIYLWDKDLYKGIPASHQLMLAVLNSLTSLIPKLLFVYYVLYYNLPKLLNSKRERKKYFAQLLLALIITVFLYRAIAILFQGPVIYKGMVNFGPFFSGSRFLQFLMDIGFASGAAIVIKQFRLQLADKEKRKEPDQGQIGNRTQVFAEPDQPPFPFQHVE